MNEETLDRLLDRLQPVAERLGQGAEFLWEVSYRQVIIRGLVWLAVGLVLLALSAVAVWAARREVELYRRLLRAYENDREARLKEAAKRDYHYGGFPVGPSKPYDRTFDLGVAAAAFAILSLWPFGMAVTRLTNPGYYAVDALMRAVGL